MRDHERVKAAKGRPHGGPRPYGYVYRAGLLVVVEAESVIVVRIFNEFTAGRSLTAIARDLQADGVPSVHGGPWRQSTVSGVVRNVRYVGKTDNNGEVFDGVHEPIVVAVPDAVELEHERVELFAHPFTFDFEATSPAAHLPWPLPPRPSSGRASFVLYT